MPNRLILEVGAETIVIPIKGTAAQIRAAIKRYAVQEIIPIEGRTPTEIGTDVLTKLLKTMRDGSVDRHRIEKLEEARPAIDLEIAAENDL